MPKIIEYSIEALAKLKEGVDALADVVKASLGPRGRNVVIERKFGSPLITKNGVTAAVIVDKPEKKKNSYSQSSPMY